MKLSDALIGAIEVFRELGWADASPEQVMELPLGTPEQRRAAKAGLSKGAWGEFGQVGEHSYGWISWIDVEEAMLGAFAIRVGVPVKRAVAVMPAVGFSPGLRARLIASRGPEFVGAFVEASGRRAGSFISSLVAAVADTGAEVPGNLSYLEGWAVLAGNALGAPLDRLVDGLTSIELIEARYADHLRAALRSGNPAPYGAVELLGGGVERGWIDPEEARELVLSAMEQAQRPIDRKTWASVLTETLGATPKWLLERAGVLVSTMSFGDDPVIARFAPVLLASGDDDLVLQAMLIGLTSKSAKAKAELLAVAFDTPAPSAETAAMVAEAVAPLLTAKDRKVRTRAEALTAAWRLDAAPEPAEVPEAPRGLWQPTPPLAEVPRFDAGPVSGEHLTRLTSALVVSKQEGITLDGERFLATVNALAGIDLDATRIALHGVKNVWNTGFIGVHEWMRGDRCLSLDSTDPQAYMPYRDAVVARGASVFQRLGAVGVLLSTPSWADWRLDPADLADRLDIYAAAGEPVIEADLQLALPRLDLELVTEELAVKLRDSELRIVLQDGSLAPLTVGQVLDAWLREPPTHPGFEKEGSTIPKPVAVVPAIEQLPPRLTSDYVWAPIPVFPNWQEAGISDRNPDPAILRSQPNGVTPSTQLLDNVGEDGCELDAAIAAWQNGVLLPGVAEAARLGWRGKISSLASRAEKWSELAEAGLLSVVWPLAADTIAHSSRGTRVSPGVAELVELLRRFLPEVRAAVEEGVAAADALGLSGVRALAQRGGSSQAVVAARSLVELLPPVDPADEPRPEAQTLTDEEFEAAWPDLADPPVVRDGATFEVEQRPGLRGGSYLEPVITLHDGSVHRVTDMYWAVHPLTNERQLLIGGDVRTGMWLRFSAEATVLALEHDRRYESRGEDDRVFSHTLATVLCLTQSVLPDPPDHQFYSEIESGLLGARRVTAVIEDLLGRERIDPYRLIRRLPRNPAALPVLFPVLTRSIRHSAALEGKPPGWLVRIIDVASEFAPVLREAAARGLLPAEDAAWPGLAEIARSSASPAAKKKAALLLEALAIG